jgi:hypothetical protein
MTYNHAKMKNHEEILAFSYFFGYTKNIIKLFRYNFHCRFVKTLDKNFEGDL